MNDKHFPAGSEKGGQFAPKNSSGADFSVKKRGQKEFEYQPDKDWDEYCVDKIVEETNLDVMEANKLNNSLQKYISNVEKVSPDDIENIDKLISKMDKFEGTIFRGMSFYGENEIDEFMQKFQEGNIIETNSLSSWTSDSKVTLYSEFSNWQSQLCDSVILKCKNNKSGAGISHISSHNYESEVLCPTTAKYKVKSIIGESKPGGKRRIMIEVEEI